MELTLEQAKQILKNTHRYELQDRYFGDMEVTFKDPTTGETIADGYSGGEACDVHFLQGGEFSGEEAYLLLKLGKLIKVTYNDSMDDEE